MTAADTDALQAALQAVPLLADRVHISIARDVTAPDSAPPLDPPYVLIHPAMSPDEQDRVTGPYTDTDVGHVIHSVGESAAAALLISEAVDGALRPGGRGIRLAVEGRRTGQIRRTAHPGVDIDDSGTPWLCFDVSEYAFRSTPA